MPKVRRIPSHHDSNGWWGILDEVQARPALNGKVRVDTAIIGGGICGVSVASRLAELCPSDEICLIEAERVGYGASGRNAGFLQNMHSHGPPKDLTILRRNMKLWQYGLDSLRRKVQAGQIQCNWSEAGRFYGAAGPDGEKHVREIGQTLDALGMEYSPLDRAALAARIGTEFYTEGLFAPGIALANPSALMRGLAQNLPSNVTVFEESPVNSFERHGTGYLIRTPGGTVLADRLVLAAGVFLKDFGIATGRYVSMATYASLTAPLDDRHMAILGTGEEFGLLGGSEVGSTIRLTQDRRLFVRNYYEFEPGASASGPRVEWISQMHRKAMLDRWPGFSDVEFEHSWGGAMAFTSNNGAVFGEYGKNLYAVLTNDVSPMTRGEGSGALLAEYMQGIDSDLLSIQLAFPNSRRLPPRPFLDLGIRVRNGYKRLIAANEV